MGDLQNGCDPFTLATVSVSPSAAVLHGPSPLLDSVQQTVHPELSRLPKRVIRARMPRYPGKHRSRIHCGVFEEVFKLCDTHFPGFCWQKSSVWRSSSGSLMAMDVVPISPWHTPAAHQHITGLLLKVALKRGRLFEEQFLSSMHVKAVIYHISVTPFQQ